ncbi:MAG: hypothetical protein U5L00_09490 [Desulfovermiculus sp.]|nr:hypothetical protein [Desulfovermiculus sp.]
MNNLLQDCLSSIDCGNICTLFTHDPVRILSEIELGAARAEDILFCVCLLDPLPEVQSLLSQAIERLALAAFSIFPTWYDRGVSIDPDSSLAVADQLSMPANAHLWAVPGPSKPWLQRAVHSCLAGRHPLLRKYAKHIQADQLALAIGRQRLCLGLVVDDASPRPENLLGLAKAAEWLARITRSRIVLILPQAVATWSEVQGIAFASLPGQTVVQDPGGNEGTPPPHLQERKYTDKIRDLVLWKMGRLTEIQTT